MAGHRRPDPPQRRPDLGVGTSPRTRRSRGDRRYRGPASATGDRPRGGHPEGTRRPFGKRRGGRAAHRGTLAARSGRSGRAGAARPGAGAGGGRGGTASVARGIDRTRLACRSGLRTLAVGRHERSGAGRHQRRGEGAAGTVHLGTRRAAQALGRARPRAGAPRDLPARPGGRTTGARGHLPACAVHRGLLHLPRHRRRREPGRVTGMAGCRGGTRGRAGTRHTDRRSIR